MTSVVETQVTLVDIKLLVARLNKVFGDLTSEELQMLVDVLLGQPSWLTPFCRNVWSPEHWLGTGVFGSVIPSASLAKKFNKEVAFVYWDAAAQVLRVH